MSSSSSTFASFIATDIVSLFGQPVSRMPHRLLDDLILAVLVSPEALQLVLELLLGSIMFRTSSCSGPSSKQPGSHCRVVHSAAQSVFDFGLPRLHVLMSLVIESDHPCAKLNSGRDDILPWIHVQQPRAPATMREVSVSGACNAREDNTGRDDHSMDGVQHCFSPLA